MDKIYFRKHLLFSIFSQVLWTKSSNLMLCWCEGADHQDAWWAPMLGGGDSRQQHSRGSGDVTYLYINKLRLRSVFF